MLNQKRYQEIIGVLFILFSILLLLSLISFSAADYDRLFHHSKVYNLIGPVGVLVSHSLRSLFGISSFIIVILCIHTGWLIIKDAWKDSGIERIFSFLFIMISSAALFSLAMSSQIVSNGGYVGHYITRFLLSIIGTIGTFCVVIVFNVISLIFGGIFSLSGMHHLNMKERFGNIINMICSFFYIERNKVVYPHNSLADGALKHGRVPWVTKKRIIVYETEKSEEPLTMNALPFLEMKDSDHDAEVFSSTRGSEENILQDMYPLQKYDTVDADVLSLEIIKVEKDEYFEQNCSHCINQPLEQEVVIDQEGPFEEEIEETYENDKKAHIAELENNAETIVSCRTQYIEEIPINSEYIIPTSFLCSSAPLDNESWQNEMKKNSLLLVNTLAEFGVESRVINVNRGPVLTLYEMQIAPGIKVNKIVGLADDIAMALAASRVRVVAPIPGKSAIGVEIPNRERETVTLGDIIKSDEYQKHHGSLKVGLGKDILGKPVMLDLKKLPHLLIAGATGSGKSVCVNSIITSLIYNYGPNYVRFILIDPKMVELQLYDGMPHLLTPVITDPLNVPQALRWTMHEMERRYRLLSELNTRDIERYNQKIEMENMGIEKLPFIVTFIDELADLMMMASKEIEGYITRIAQKARAVGIHLVFATQRPSVDIITGIIKANIPARIAFQVAQKTDSRTIIDQNGAEKLLGKGDMLYQSPMSSFPIRIQGALIIEEEIMEIVSHLKKMGNPSYIDIEECIFDDMSDDIDGEGDDLFVEALKIVEETKKASASYLQRRLSIGYNRAARIIEQMEDLGYIGPQQGSKPREVFI